MRAMRRTSRMLFGYRKLCKKIILKQIAECIHLTQRHGGLNGNERSVFVKCCRRPLVVLLHHCNGTYSNFPFEPFGWTVKVRSVIQRYECMRSSQLLRLIVLVIDIIGLVAFFYDPIHLSPWSCLFPIQPLSFYYQNLSLLYNFTTSLFRAPPPIPFLVVTGRTTKGLADQFNILGS